MTGSRRSRKSRDSRKAYKSHGKTYLPKPTKGALGKYTTKDDAKTRRKYLEEDIKEPYMGYTAVMRDLNVRATMNKNKNPEVTKKMKADMAYLRKKEKSRRSRKSRASRKSRK